MQPVIKLILAPNQWKTIADVRVENKSDDIITVELTIAKRVAIKSTKVK